MDKAVGVGVGVLSSGNYSLCHGRKVMERNIFEVKQSQEMAV